MHDIIKHFVRDQAGIWICIASTEIEGGHGRLRVGVGERFPHGEKRMGVELASLLDELYEADRAHGPN